MVGEQQDPSVATPRQRTSRRLTTWVVIANSLSGDYDMRHITKLLMSGVLATSLVAGCNGDDLTNAPDGPSAPIPAPLPTPTPEPTSGPPTAAVAVGDIFFESGHNGSSDPAVDTVAVNGTVT
jgi:hypothetical protein